MKSSFVCLMIFSTVGLAEPPIGKVKPVYKMSKEATFITEPLTDDGYLDYEAALNQHLRANIKADENANVIIWKAIGPDVGNRRIHADFWKWLECDAPKQPEKPVVESYKFCRDYRQKMGHDDETWSEFNDQLFGLVDRCKTRPWTKNDSPEIEQWVIHHSHAIQLIQDACLRKEFFHPTISRTKDGLPGMLMGALHSEHLSATRTIAEVINCRIFLSLGQNKTTEAWNDIVTLFQLSRLLQKGSSDSDFLVGLAVESFAQNALVHFIAWTNPSSDQIQKYHNQLVALISYSKTSDKVNWHERLIILDTFSRFPKDDGKVSRDMAQITNLVSFDFIKGTKIDPADCQSSLVITNLYFDQLTELLTNASYSEVNQKYANLLREQKKSNVIKGGKVAKWRTEKSPVIELLAMEWMELAGKVHFRIYQAEVRTRQQFANLQVVMALSAYFADKKEYPAKLAELTPQYLLAIPLDLYTGQALHYEPSEDGFLILSAGNNGKNEGTLYSDSVAEGKPRGDDVGFRFKRMKK